MDDKPRRVNSGHRRTVSFAQKSYGPVRQLVFDITEGKIFETIMSCLILFNIVLMMIETDDNGRCVSQHVAVDNCSREWVGTTNLFLLGAYTVELVLRLFALRLEFFRIHWNYLDGFIVVAGWVDFIMAQTVGSLPGPSASLLRIFRVTRLARIARVVGVFPELYALIRGFVGAMRSMFWGFMMILVFLIVFSILSVELLNPVNVDLVHDNEYCLEAFSSIWNSLLLYLQTLVAGDSWGQCAIPVIQESKPLALLFICSLICVQLGVTNLILAVIVEEASKAHDADIDQKLMMKANEQKTAARRLKEDLEEIDTDQNGKISISELREGFDSNPDLQMQLRSLDIQRKDLEDLFYMLDDTKEGELEYDRLIQTIVQARMDDVGKQIMMLRLQCAEMAHLLAELNPNQAQATARVSRSGTAMDYRVKSTTSGDSMLPRSVEYPVIVDSSLSTMLDDLQRDVLRSIHSWASVHKLSLPSLEEQTSPVTDGVAPSKRLPGVQGAGVAGSQVDDGVGCSQPGDGNGTWQGRLPAESRTPRHQL